MIKLFALRAHVYITRRYYIVQQCLQLFFSFFFCLFLNSVFIEFYPDSNKIFLVNYESDFELLYNNITLFYIFLR